MVRKFLLLSIVALAIGAALWFALTKRTGPSEPSDPPAVTTPIAAQPNPTPVSGPDPPIVERVANSDGPRLRGYVQSLATGEGIRNAAVAIRWDDGEDRTRRDLTTDASGEFLLSDVAEGEYTIWAWHDRFASEQSRYVVKVESGEAPSDLIIWMTAGGAISGRVYDASTNEGIAGIKVGLDRSQTRGVVTDREGRYQIAGVRAGNRRVYVGHAAGYIDSRELNPGLRVVVSPDQELANVDFPLQRGVFAAIEGKVVDADGNPVSGAEVRANQIGSLTHRGQGKTEKTGRDGTFRLAELQVADGFYVSAKAPGVVSEELGPFGLTVDGIRDLVLTLRPTASISGQVVDETTGDPVGETAFAVKTMYTGQGRNFIDGRPNHLAEDGRFELLNLAPGSYGIYLDPYPNVFHTGWPRPQVTVDVNHGQHVKDVVLTYDYARYLQSKAAPRTRPKKTAAQVRAETPRVGEVRGRVVRGDTQEPVTSFNMKTSYSSGHSSRTMHDPDGRFTLGETNGETLTLTISAHGYVPKVEVIQGGLGTQPVHDITVRLKPGAVVEGVVVDAYRKPVAGAEVYIGVDPSEHQSKPLGIASDAVSRIGGTFRLDTLSASSTRVYARHPAFAVGSAEVTPSASRPTRVVIVLEKGGSIEGAVRRAGVPLAGQTIMVLNAAGKNVRVIGNTTDSTGRYRLEHLAPGTYEVYTYIEDFERSLRIEAVVRNGKTTPVDFDFTDTGDASNAP